MKPTLIILQLLLSGIVFAETTKVTTKEPTSYTIPVPVHDTIYQKIYLDNVDNTDFWDSKFWPGAFAFLTVLVSVGAIVYQTSRTIPDEAKKILINKVIETHQKVLLVQNQVSTSITNGEKEYLELFEDIKAFSKYNDELCGLLGYHSSFLSKKLQYDLQVLNDCIILIMGYANTNETLQEIGQALNTEMVDLFNNTINDVGKFYQNLSSWNYVCESLNDEDYKKIDKWINDNIISKIKEVTNSNVEG